MSHPNGILPGGNAFVLGDRAFEVRNQGLGPFFRRLSDEFLVEMLAFVDGQSLGRLCQVSRALYLFAHVDNVWRDLVLLMTGGQGIAFLRTWKETYASHFISKSGVDRREDVQLVRPIKVKGFFSHHLFHHWLCCSFDLERAVPGLYRHEDIPRVPAESLSVKQFIEQYEVPNKPVIITGAVDHWPAMGKWSANYLADACGTQTLRATSAAAALPGHFTAREYFNYASLAKEESPLYLFDRDFHRIEALKSDYEVPKYFSCAEWKRDPELRDKWRRRNGDRVKEGEGFEGEIDSEQEQVYHTDLFRLLGEGQRPDYKWVVAGPARSGSIFHIDPNQTNAWNVLLTGHKKWIFYPPGVSPPGVQSSPDGAEVVVPVSTGEWLLTFWAFHQEARMHPDPSKRPLEAVLGPGEVIFVPHGYWHMVVNLDDTVALTHNYVSTSNLADVLRFLRDKVDQISGVRCRTVEDEVRPESVYTVFVEKLTSFLGEERVKVFVAESLKNEHGDGTAGATSVRCVGPRKHKGHKRKDLERDDEGETKKISISDSFSHSQSESAFSFGFCFSGDSNV